jgi:hypothetical protein
VCEKRGSSEFTKDLIPAALSDGRGTAPSTPVPAKSLPRYCLRGKPTCLLRAAPPPSQFHTWAPCDCMNNDGAGDQDGAMSATTVV